MYKACYQLLVSLTCNAVNIDSTGSPAVLSLHLFDHYDLLHITAPVTDPPVTTIDFSQHLSTAVSSSSFFYGIFGFKYPFNSRLRHSDFSPSRITIILIARVTSSSPVYFRSTLVSGLLQPVSPANTHSLHGWYTYDQLFRYCMSNDHALSWG